MTKRSARLLVTGTRYGRPDVSRQLDAFLEWAERNGVSIFAVLCGGASGVDAQAKVWAEKKGIRCDVFLAAWARGPKAGPERNQRMVDACEPGDFCLAFPHDTEPSTGTHDCAQRAKRRGLTVYKLPAKANPYAAKGARG